jgi:hypothetical protein
MEKSAAWAEVFHLFHAYTMNPDLEKRDYHLGIRHADHVAPSIRKSWH